MVKNKSFYLVTEEVLNQIEPLEAQALALDIRQRQENQLMLDAKIGDALINGERVVEGLERTWVKLLSKYDWISTEWARFDQGLMRNKRNLA